jgi:hypothetical protein
VLPHVGNLLAGLVHAIKQACTTEPHLLGIHLVSGGAGGIARPLVRPPVASH